MPALFALLVVMAATVAFAPVNPNTHFNAGPFLMKIAEEQQAEITVSLLATRKAESERVKSFGAHMIDEHTKTKTAVEQMALQQHIVLYPGLNHNHEIQLKELSQLTGSAFDLAYMNHVMRGHDTAVSELEEHARTLPYPDLKQWIDEVVPVINSHREKARLVQNTLQEQP